MLEAAYRHYFAYAEDVRDRSHVCDDAFDHRQPVQTREFWPGAGAFAPVASRAPMKHGSIKAARDVTAAESGFYRAVVGRRRGG